MCPPQETPKTDTSGGQTQFPFYNTLFLADQNGKTYYDEALTNKSKLWVKLSVKLRSPGAH